MCVKEAHADLVLLLDNLVIMIAFQGRPKAATAAGSSHAGSGRLAPAPSLAPPHLASPRTSFDAECMSLVCVQSPIDLVVSFPFYKYNTHRQTNNTLSL